MLQPTQIFTVKLQNYQHASNFQDFSGVFLHQSPFKGFFPGLY